ncbi:Hypothetical protein R9X50_00721800 [Acrodontium crateriforme]|uniref:ACB domain-containing protein n=1 Tax=Acrodontium crateriforme TaxID=150365 RepID=A0AAQ3MAG9_9PEZI|nr:Hypothetical protein R9X50_00721800 [Acrodontium crateriforme]
MADSVDRVFGVALNTVSRIRPGAQRPPAQERLALYGLYKQAMEGDVSAISDRPTKPSPAPGVSSDAADKEIEKWDAWKSNEGLTRTEAKRRYIERLIDTMHQYASGTDEARELVDELEFVWDQIKNNSHHSSSERSSPLRNMDRSGYDSEDGMRKSKGGISSMEAIDSGIGGDKRAMRILSPVSQADEEEERDDEEEADGEEFVDAPVSQVDNDEDHHAVDEASNSGFVRPRIPQSPSNSSDVRWRKRIESSLIKLTTEVAALREQLESRRFFSRRQKHSALGWIFRLSWWAVQLVVTNAAILWIVILYMRRKKDPRLEGAVRVLLGDAVAQVQKVKMPSLPKLAGKKNG